METTDLSGITCHIIINGTDLPTIYWGEMENHTESMKKVLGLCEDVKCNYVIFEVRDWNSAFSPWEFELSKKQYFSGGGRNTLEWLINECIPHCEREYSLSGKRIICGYSLAGLFSLWAFYESQIFSGVIRTCPHKKFRTSFRQILPIATSKILAIRQYVCGFFSCTRQNYARKTAHNFYVDRF